MHAGYDSGSPYGKIAENIKPFEKLLVSTIDLRFLKTDKSSLTKAFIKNKARFHKACGNKFSDLKLEKSEKRLNKDNSNDNVLSIDDKVHEGNYER